MAEILTEDKNPLQIRPWRQRKPTIRVYPWDEWADGQARRLTQGIDYQCDTQSLKRQARRAAYRRGVRLLTQATPTNIVIQFIPAAEEPDGNPSPAA